MTVAFVGDIHADWKRLDEIFQEDTEPDMPIVQVGDLGLGFPPMINVATGLPFPPEPKEFPERFRFIRGNHDNPETCRTFPNYLGDSGYNDTLDLFFISGARSHDIDLRTPGLDWWRDEELSILALDALVADYVHALPSVVVSHTCPLLLARLLVDSEPDGRTERVMDILFKIHQPDLWIFGHWHRDMKTKVGKTHFVCLAPGVVDEFEV